MSKPELEIAQLSHTILGNPEEHLDQFKLFFNFGTSQIPGQENQVTDPRIRTLALLSATAVLIDIFPSMVLTAEPAEQESDANKKASKEYLGKMKRSKMVIEFFDGLLQRLNKIKLARGVCALLQSSICSTQLLDVRRVQQLVSSAVSLGCQPIVGKEVVAALRNRITSDLANHVDNLEIVKLIVTSIAREKQPARLNLLVPILENIRFTAPNATPRSSLQTGGAKVDRKLLRDLATGRGDYVDIKKIKQAEAQILAEVVALCVRIARGAQSGQYTFAAIRICIQGLASNTSAVNSDLAIELEQELLGLAKFYLAQNDTSDNGEKGLLGAIALSALLNITKGTKERSEILTGSVISGVETLVPLALEKLLQSSTEGTQEVLASLCKGAIGVSAQFGSDKALLSVARALLTSICMRFDDQSKLAVDLLIHVASRSPLVRTAIDPDGVLVDGAGLAKEEVSLFHQLSALVGNHGVDSELGNKLLGNLAKYCRELASRVRLEAASKAQEEVATKVIQKKRELVAERQQPKKNKKFKA